MLSQNFQEQIKLLTGDVVTECNTVFDNKTRNYSMMAIQLLKDIENKSHEYIDELNKLIEGVQQKQKAFFTFETIKKWIFIGGSIANFLILILLIIFDFKK